MGLRHTTTGVFAADIIPRSPHSQAETFRQAAKRLRARCRTCGEVVSADVWTDSMHGSLVIVVRCHGVTEVTEADERLTAPRIWEIFASALKNAFLPPVARHGTVSADARRERRMGRR